MISVHENASLSSYERHLCEVCVSVSDFHSSVTVPPEASLDEWQLLGSSAPPEAVPELHTAGQTSQRSRPKQHSNTSALRIKSSVCCLDYPTVSQTSFLLGGFRVGVDEKCVACVCVDNQPTLSTLQH